MSATKHPGWTAAYNYFKGTQTRMPSFYSRPGSTLVCDTGYLMTVKTYNSVFFDPFYKVGLGYCHGTFGDLLSYQVTQQKASVSVDYVISSVWYLKSTGKDYHKQVKAWLDFLFSPKESPFRGLFGEDGSGLELHEPDENGVPTFFTLKVDKETNLQLLMGFMIATRYTFEKVDRIHSWEQLVSSGVNKHLTTFLINPFSNITIKGDVVKLTYASMEPTHTFMYGYSMEKSISRLSRAEPVLKDDHLLYRAGSYGQISLIWYSGGINFSKEDLFGELKKLFDSKSGLSGIVGKEIKVRKSKFGKVTDLLVRKYNNYTGQNSYPYHELSLAKLVAYVPE